ncbi:MAG: hypothetical protein QW228_09395 [Candidatus Aenigmatarchaeota archaeon]
MTFKGTIKVGKIGWLTYRGLDGKRKGPLLAVCVGAIRSVVGQYYRFKVFRLFKQSYLLSLKQEDIIEFDYIFR